MSLLIQRKTLEEVQRSLAAYLPGGPLWESAMIPGTNLNAVIGGTSGLLLDVEVFNVIYNSEFIPSSSGTNFLEEWERAVQIPDDCFPGASEPDRSVRRLHVLVKLASLGVQSAADFERLAAILGSDASVSSLAETEPLTEGAAFTILVEGENLVGSVPPYDVPFDIVSGDDIVQCLFTRLKPVNCAIVFRNTN